jgi:hypothetical protein
VNRLSADRRRFLKLVGASALTYPFIRALPSFAAPAGDPQYMVLVFTPCGVVRHLWGATGPARGSSIVTSQLTGASGAGMFRPTLQPFATGMADLSSQMIVLDGLNVATADGSHEAGMASLWTACLSTGQSATSISIDQAIAGQLNSGRPFSTIQLQVRSSQDFNDREVKTRMCYAESNGVVGYVDPIDDPVQARNTIFPSAASSGSSSSSGPDKKTYIRQQVFNQMNTELTAMQSKLCNEDKQQLQTIQDAWNQLDSQLKNAASAAASCMPPEAAPAGYAAPSIDFQTSAKLQMDILALALACDLTRVASLQFSTATSQVTHSWLSTTSLPQNDIHHNYSHQGPSSLYSLGPDLYNTSTYNTPLSSMPIYTGQLAAIDLWYATQVAYLANRLGSLNSSAGKNLLQQSVIVWGNELDLGAAHNHDDTPFLLIGSCGGKLKTGQLVQFPLNLANNASNSPPTGNRFHNDLHISLAQAMGVSMTTFGTASGVTSHSNGKPLQFVNGPISQILV